MKHIRLSILLLFCILCIPKKGISQTMYAENMSLPLISSQDKRIYMCARYTNYYTYRKKPYSKRLKEEEREVCSCFNTNIYWLAADIRVHSGTMHTGGENTIIIWDTNFVRNYILPVFTKIEDRRKIRYTIEHTNENTFKNIIDYDNKVIINDKMYYYPMNVRTCIYFATVNYEWLKTVLPESSWIYEPACFDAGEGMRVSMLIPLLDER